VSSFVTRYGQWQAGQRRRPYALPPLRTNINALNPPLYRGQCIKFDQGYTTASIKAWNGSDWIWIEVPIASKRRRHAIPTNKALSPLLLTDGASVRLAIPFESRVIIPSANSVHRACAVDLGINTTATASIVTRDGTVVARKFIHRGADIDRRDKGLLQIRSKAGLTMGATGKLGRGFCRHAYRKAANRNRDMANRLAGEIVSFALEHGAEALVFEHLQHFRPAAGKRRSTLRQRFHGWLHRKLFEKVSARAQEACLRVACVNARGTSKYAYDGSGEVRRDPDNRALATFQDGRRYNADLNASYNIAARFFARVLGLSGRKAKACASGKSSRTQPRIPVTLSTLWLHAQSSPVVECEAATTASFSA
jgi:IS605 OrfB family transposase